MTRYVYVKSKSGENYTVGFYTPTGEWIPESDHGTSEKAAMRVSCLNGNKVRVEMAAGALLAAAKAALMELQKLPFPGIPAVEVMLAHAINQAEGHN